MVSDVPDGALTLPPFATLHQLPDGVLVIDALHALALSVPEEHLPWVGEES